MGKRFTIFDEECMQHALDEARQAFIEGEVPVGAILILEGKIIARAHNQVERFKDASCHAEILCLKEGARILGDWRLAKSTLYITLEPCAMCAGAAILFRVGKIIWGAPDPRQGAAGSLFNLFQEKHPIHQVEILSGLYAEESRTLMQDFFKQRRKESKIGKKCL